MRQFKLVFLSALLFLSACGVDDKTSNSGLEEVSNTEQPEVALAVSDPGKTGSYQVLSYTPSPAKAGYQSAIVYYPSTPAGSLLPATTVSGGYTNTKEQMSWLGKHLASHGIVAIIFTPTNTTASSAQIWANGHLAALATLQNENKRNGSPLLNRLNVNRQGVMGYSYGGAGAILAANQSPTQVAAAIPLCAYQPAKPTSSIPYLFVTGTRDTVASPTAILNVFNSSKTGQPKAFARFNGLSHLDIVNGGRYHESVARYVTAWSLLYLGENQAYATYINGDMAKKQAADTSVFAKSTDYIFQN